MLHEIGDSPTGTTSRKWILHNPSSPAVVSYSLAFHRQAMMASLPAPSQRQAPSRHASRFAMELHTWSLYASAVFLLWPDARAEQSACRHQWLAIRRRQDPALDPRLRDRTHPAYRRFAVRARPDPCSLGNGLLRHQVAWGLLSHLPRRISHSHARRLRRCASSEPSRRAAKRAVPPRRQARSTCSHRVCGSSP